MKKVMLFGAVCLLGMASCKTYCPAYSQNETAKPAATAKAPAAEKAVRS